MRDLGMNGVRRGKSCAPRSRPRTATGPGTCSTGDFTAPAPNRVWVADFTYCRTWAGFVYVAFVVECFSQRIVGWQAATDRRTELVLTPLRMALWDRGRARPSGRARRAAPPLRCRQPIHLIRFTEHLALEGIAPSIGTVGDAYDNALMESIIGLFKTEGIAPTVFHDGPYKNLADVEYATAGWVDWYNHRRLHSSLGMLTPPSTNGPLRCPQPRAEPE